MGLHGRAAEAVAHERVGFTRRRAGADVSADSTPRATPESSGGPDGRARRAGDARAEPGAARPPAWPWRSRRPAPGASEEYSCDPASKATCHREAARPIALGAHQPTGVVEKALTSDGRTKLDLDRLDPAPVVAKEAAAGLELEQPLAHLPVLGVETEQGQRPGGLCCERTPNTNVAPIRFCSDSRSPRSVSVTCCVLMIGTASSDRPIRWSEASSIRPTGSPSSRHPSSKEKTFSRLALGAHQVQREHRDQSHDLLADPLGLRVLRPGRTRRRPRKVPDRQIGDLVLAHRGEAHVWVGEPQLGQPGPRITSSVRPAWPSVSSPSLSARTTSVQVGRSRLLSTRSTALTIAVSHVGSERAREQVAQERDRRVLAQLRRRHPQRVEHPSQRRGRARA